MEVLRQDQYDGHCIRHIGPDLRSTADEKRQTIYQRQLESTCSVSSSRSPLSIRSDYERVSSVNQLDANNVTWYF